MVCQFLFVLALTNFSMRVGFNIKLPCSGHSKKISIRFLDSVSNGLRAQQANQTLFPNFDGKNALRFEKTLKFSIRKRAP